MFANPDQNLAGMRVYFDVFPTMGGPHEGSPTDGTNVNPNVGTIGSRIAPAGLVVYRAFFGVWKDCNKDGYIGHAESALQDYRSEVLALLGSNICPAGGAFNDGQWVSEFLMMGMVDPCEVKDDAYRAANCPSTHYGLISQSKGGVPAYFHNPTVIYATNAYVWGDYGLPGAEPRVECAARPAPRGTTSSAAGLLRVADCQAGFVVEKNTSGTPLHGILAQSFPVTPFGDPASDAPGLLERESGREAVTVWDCSKPNDSFWLRDPTADPGKRGSLSGAHVSDPTGGDLSGAIPVPVIGQRTIFGADDQQAHVYWTNSQGTYVSAPAIDPRVHDARGSYWDAAETALDGTTPTGDCNPNSPSPLRDAYVGAFVENDRENVASSKNQASFTFFFYDGYRGLDPRVDGFFDTWNAPTDGGVAYTRSLYGGALWSATSSAVAEPQLFDRSTLAPEGARYASFYATVDDGTIASKQLMLPKSQKAIYGREACGTSIGAGAADANMWTCDPAKWWKDSYGNDITPRFAEGERMGRMVGDTYFLRDVDCWDGSAASGVRVGLGSACV